MPLGEDFPVMLMISLVVVFLIIFLFYFINQSQDRTEMVEMSEEAINMNKVLVGAIGNYQIINGSFLSTFPKGYCGKISSIGIESAYISEINITNRATGDNWCFSKGDIKNAHVCVRRTFNSLIETYGGTDFAKIEVRICK